MEFQLFHTTLSASLLLFIMAGGSWPVSSIPSPAVAASFRCPSSWQPACRRTWPLGPINFPRPLAPS